MVEKELSYIIKVESSKKGKGKNEEKSNYCFYC